MQDMETTPVGQYLRELRQRVKLSLREVEQQVGISNSYLSQVETGQRRPGTNVLKRLAPLYGVSVRDLLERAGHLVEIPAEVPEDEEVERAYQFVLSDPRFRFGTSPRGEMDTESRRFIVQMYETLTGKRLLD
ncbi:MAG: helix-turn-helix transcriptional regulator, partial [Dehalococcoidia bacterium]|nr:helix-turn-helix transcriptional regulator [Dehalococcoidia bacterium]